MKIDKTAAGVARDEGDKLTFDATMVRLGAPDRFCTWNQLCRSLVKFILNLIHPLYVLFPRPCRSAGDSEVGNKTRMFYQRHRHLWEGPSVALAEVV